MGILETHIVAPHPSGAKKIIEIINIEQGMVIECPNVPADTEFSSERGRYEGNGLYVPRDLAIGIIDFKEMTDDNKEPAKRIVGSDLYPALSGFYQKITM